MNNLPKVVTQQRHGRASNPRLLDRKSNALPLSHRATLVLYKSVLKQGFKMTEDCFVIFGFLIVANTRLNF